MGQRCSRPIQFCFQPMKLLLPFAWLYAAVMALRNRLFDTGCLKQRSFPLPVISVGNLAVGGTGKTPHTEYILRLLTGCGYFCGMLSRGYGRTTRGFVEGAGSKASAIGDEPWQVQHACFATRVCVCEDRCAGLDRMLQSGRRPDVVVLDDAYQHRYVKPGLSVLLTDYASLYCDDDVLPAGRLRESASGARRADVIVVTKCPSHLSQSEQQDIKTRLQPEVRQHLFFSTMVYGNIYNVYPEAASLTQGTNVDAPVAHLEKLHVLLVCGIARPQAFIEHFQSRCASVQTLTFADHHRFSNEELLRMAHLAEQVDMVITTAKDAARLSDYDLPPVLRKKLCVQPIEVVFLNEDTPKFNQIIIDYVTENTRDCTVD